MIGEGSQIIWCERRRKGESRNDAAQRKDLIYPNLTRESGRHFESVTLCFPKQCTFLQHLLD